MENVEKKSFVQRVLDSFKEGDEKKLAKFQKWVIKWAKNQISEIKQRVENNTERLEQKQEQLDEYILAVDFDRIKDIDDRERYGVEYVSGYDNMVVEIDNLKEEIEDDSILIEKRKALIEKMQ
jgi:hypothetical protein